MSTMRKHSILVGFVALAIGLLGIRIPVGDSLWAGFAIRVVLTAIMFTIMIKMAGKKVLFHFSGIWYAFKKSWYCLLIAAVTFFLFMRSVSIEPGTGKGMIVLKTVLFCTSVGFFEESLFRGVLLSGFLKKWGGRKSGMIASLILSSFIFGFVHVLTYAISGSYDVPGVLQAVLKTGHAMMFAMLMACIYIKTKNIWIISLIHAVNDVLDLLPAQLLGDTKLATYVMTGDGAWVSIIFYTFFLILYLPLIVVIIRTCRTLTAPDYGVFQDE